MKMKKMWRAGLLVIVTAGFSNLAVLSSLAQITASPTDQSVNVGGTATFTIADATATAYEWHLNGAILANGVNANGSTYAGVNTATLTISGVTPQDAAPAATGYACVVVDNTGNPTSNPAALVVRLVRFAFDDATGTTTTTSDTDSGVGASLNMALGATATDYHGAANSGVNGIGRALDFSAFTTQNQTPLPGPIASNNAVASLGFKTLERYTATIWFKIRAGATSISGGQNPRFFILGPSGTTDNGGNILTLKLGDGGTGINNFKANANNNELTPVQWTNNASITAEDWIFLAINYDGTTMTYYTGYVAGASSLAGSQGVSGNIAIGSSGALMIGNRAVDKARTFAGWIDDFRFFSGAGGAGLVENARLLAITAGPTVTAVVKTNNQVALSWTPFNPPGQTGPVTYNVKRATTSGGP